MQCGASFTVCSAEISYDDWEKDQRCTHVYVIKISVGGISSIVSKKCKMRFSIIRYTVALFDIFKL